MHLTIECPGCGRRLRAPAEYRGQKASCRRCSAAVAIPSAGNDALVASGYPAWELNAFQEFNDPRRWCVRTPEGVVYGPVSRRDLDAWVLEGRINAFCAILPPQSEGWVAAASFYPLLAPYAPTPATNGAPLPSEGERDRQERNWAILVALGAVVGAIAIALLSILLLACGGRRR
jgi:hypothetical protein